MAEPSAPWCRYVVSTLALPISRELPWGTIAINITGSFVIGFFGTLTLAHGRYPVSENVRMFVMVGLCGGYTTYSAFSLQTLDLLRGGAPGRAAINVVASVVLCICAVAAGHIAGAALNGGAKPRAPVILVKRSGDVGVSEMRLGDVGLVIERVGRGGRA